MINRITQLLAQICDLPTKTLAEAADDLGSGKKKGLVRFTDNEGRYLDIVKSADMRKTLRAEIRGNLKNPRDVADELVQCLECEPWEAAAVTEYCDIHAPGLLARMARHSHTTGEKRDS